ncbi:MAG: D-2-hydroxyacid dehydrogenase [Burkholderiales bacterium]
MSKNKMAIIIDPKVEWYRSQFVGQFPGLDVHVVAEASEAHELVAQADAILAMGHHFHEELIAKATQLKWIQAFTTGVDQIVLLKSLRPEVLVTSMRGIHGPQLSEMAFMHMLNLSRNYRQILKNQENAVYARVPQPRLCGKTVVIVGVGLISTELAPRCKAFGMNVIGVTSAPRDVPGFDRMMRREDLVEAARIADFLIVLAPYTPENDKLVSKAVIDAMKPTGILVNIARGGVCDEDAILAAVREKRIGGAGLDVFRVEPLPPDHPFWKEERVMITPRISGGSDDYHTLTVPTIRQNLACFMEGRMQDMINVVPH